VRIIIQSRAFDQTDDLREHVERPMHFSFDWAKYQMCKISACLSVINGSYGGDKRCHIQIAVPSVVDIAAKDTEPDLYVAIDRATDRAGRTLTRRVERQHEHHHDCPRDIGAKAISLVPQALRVTPTTPGI
jgi:ribosomal subunit interface protein